MIVSLIIVSAVVLIVVGIFGWSWFRSQRCIRGRYRSTVIVTLKSGTAFRGVLFDADSGSLVLRNAEMLGQGVKAPVPVDGEVLMQLGEVEFLQRP